MISKACYVQCDQCGDPAEISTEGSKMARRYARAQGYTYNQGRDLCPRCQGEKPPIRRQVEEELSRQTKWCPYNSLATRA